MSKWMRKLWVVSLLIILSVTVSVTFAYLFDVTPSFVNTFIYNHSGSLIIDKQISHELGDDYVIPEGIEFKFDVDFGSDYKNDKVIVNGDEVTIDDSGKIEVIVEKDGEVEIRDILVGTDVTITEIELPNGFSNNQLSQTITIESIKNHNVTVLNNYKFETINGQDIKIYGTKQMNREWIDGDLFTFVMEYKNNGFWKQLGQKSVSYQGEKTFNFNDVISNFVFDHVGMYQYKFYEQVGNISGVNYSSEVYYLDVEITDVDMDGYLEINEVKLNDVPLDSPYECNLFFINTYAPVGSDSVQIDITKILNDKSGQNKSPNGFKFSLEGNGNIYESNLTSSTGEANITMVYGPEDAGNTYEYILKEVIEDKKGYKYDTKEVKLSVSIIDNLDGTVSAYIYDENETIDLKHKKYSVSFTNIYDPSDSNGVTIVGLKKLTGRELQKDEFTFELYEYNSSNQTTGSLVSTSKNDSEGNFELKTNGFDKVGAYNFIIKEKQEDLGGITYSNKSYIVTVGVIDVDGELQATPRQTEDIVFENNYSVKNNEHVISGIKKLDNYSLKDGMFTFELYENDELIRVTKNKEDGTFTFDGLVYTKDDIGEHHYVVKEKQVFNETSDEKKRITFDEHVYNLVVTVEDNLQGELDISQMITLDGNQVDQITFRNIYTPAPKPIQVDISIQKEMEIKGTQDYGLDGFTFIVEDENGKLYPAISDENGQCIISIELTEENIGTNTYKLYEQKGNVQYMTYSDEVYEIDVVVELTEENILQAQVEDTTYTFTNIYDYTPPSIETSDRNIIYATVALMVVSGMLLVLLDKRRKIVK